MPASATSTSAAHVRCKGWARGLRESSCCRRLSRCRRRLPCSPARAKLRERHLAGTQLLVRARLQVVDEVETCADMSGRAATSEVPEAADGSRCTLISNRNFLPVFMSSRSNPRRTSVPGLPKT
eukprot:768782-Hanusia_phi.AAC.13